MPADDPTPTGNIGTVSHMWDSMLNLFRDLAGVDDLHGSQALSLRAFIALLVIGGFILVLVSVIPDPGPVVYLAGGMFGLLFIAFLVLMITQVQRPPNDRRLAAAQSARAEAIAAQPIT